METIATSGVLTCGPIKRVVLLGASQLFADVIAWGDARGVEVVVLTSPDQRDCLRIDDDRVMSTPSLKADEVTAFVHGHWSARDVLGLSFGARWIIKQPTSDRLFAGKLLNAHGSRLPADRGGGGLSWRIMRGDRIGNLVLHLVDDGVDTGPLVITHDYVIPAHCRTTAQIKTDYVKRLVPFLTEFLTSVAEEQRHLPLSRQKEYSASYYPRLNTPLHGWIDWAWPPAEIERFTLAFDDPFVGTRTRWEDKVVLLRDCQLHFGEVAHHPFQSGLVIRNNGRWLTIALSGSACLLACDVRNEKGDDLLPLIREGDRLYTLTEDLDQARRQRVVIGPRGVVRK